MIRAGVSRVDITPPPGARMCCFPRGPKREPRRAVGVRDPLTARVLVICDENEAVALCSCDVCFFREPDVERIRAAVARAVPSLAGSRVVLAATHTHSSFETTYLFGNTPDDPWLAEMDARIAGAVADAFAARVPVSLEHGCVRVPLNHNRRVLDAAGKAQMRLECGPDEEPGLRDTELHTLAFVRDAAPLAVLYTYTAHALTLGPRQDRFSADYPGVAAGVIERHYPGATALFGNGAAGDIHLLHCMRADDSALLEMGAAIGAAAVQAVEQGAPLEVTATRFSADRMRFPNRVDPRLSVQAELACLDLGSAVVTFMPGEQFVAFQLALRRRLHPRVCIPLAYCHGWPGYVPTREAYPQGGYGVDLATADPPQWSRTALPPGAGEAMLDRIAALAG